MKVFLDHLPTAKNEIMVNSEIVFKMDESLKTSDRLRAMIGHVSTHQHQTHSNTTLMGLAALSRNISDIQDAMMIDVTSQHTFLLDKPEIDKKVKVRIIVDVFTELIFKNFQMQKDNW